MEAKDTVMQQIYPQNCEDHLKSLQQQAELSFKAGIREVVEWIEKQNHHAKSIGFVGINFTGWKAKLKEWKIQEDKKNEV